MLTAAGFFFSGSGVRLVPDAAGRRRMAAYLVVFLVLISPFDSGTTVSIAPIALMSAAALLLFALGAGEAVAGGALTISRRPVALLLAALLLWSLFSVTYSIDRPASEYGLVKILIATVVFFSVPRIFATGRDRLILWRTAGLLGALLALAGLVQFFVPGTGMHGSRAHAVFVTPNSFAGYLLILLPVTIALGRSVPLRAESLFWGAAAVLEGGAFLASGSRGAWLALAAAGAAWAANRPRAGRRARPPRYRRVAVPAALLCFAAVVLLSAGGGEIVDRLQSLANPFTAEMDRYKYWESTVEIIRTRPLLGYGLRTFHFLYPRYKSPDFEGVTHIYSHNDYLQMTAETGLVGGLLLCALAAAVAVTALRAVRRGRLPLETAFAVGLWGVLLHMLVDFDFHIPAIQVLFWAAAGHLAAGDGGGGLTVRLPAGSPARRAAVAAAAAAVLIVGVQIARYVAADALSAAGFRFLFRGEYRQAETAFARAAAVLPYAAFYHANYARARALRGERESDPALLRDAEASLRRALDLNPWDHATFALLGQLYARNLDLFGKEKRGDLVGLLERAVRLYPVYDAFRFQLIRALLRGGETARAIPHLEAYLARRPRDGRARLWLAESLASLGETGRAAAELRTLLDADPGNRRAVFLLGIFSRGPVQ